MRGKTFPYFIIFLLLSIGLFQCGTEKKEVLLRLKFNENQKLRWLDKKNSYEEVFENDSLIKVTNNRWEREMVEEVVKIVDSVSARYRLTSYFEKTVPDKNDSSKTLTIKDSTITEYLQNDRGVNLDIFPYDTSSLEELEYYKRLYRQMAPRYPDDPVSAGYVWSNNIKVMLEDGEIKDAVSTFKVKGFVREAGYDCVLMEYKSNIILPYHGEYIRTEDKEKVLETRIDRWEIEGTTYLAYKNGFTVREEVSFIYIGEGTRVYESGEKKILITSSGSHSYYLIGAEGI